MGSSWYAIVFVCVCVKCVCVKKITVYFVSGKDAMATHLRRRYAGAFLFYSMNSSNRYFDLSFNKKILYKFKTRYFFNAFKFSYLLYIYILQVTEVNKLLFIFDLKCCYKYCFQLQSSHFFKLKAIDLIFFDKDF